MNLTLAPPLARRVLVAVALFVLGSGAAAANITPPDEVVKKATADLQTVIGQRQAEFRASPNKLYAVMEEMVVPHFDVKYIAQLILARNWKDASEDQRKRFEVAFKNMLMRSYADALVEYHNAVKTEWQPLRMAPDARNVTVHSKLLRDNGPPLPLGFAMRLKDGRWKVYDIIIENLSLVTNFRSQVNSAIKQQGLDGLIQRLERGEALAAPKSGKDAPATGAASKGAAD